MSYENPLHDGLDLGGTTQESSREATEENLIPTGTYEGVIQEWKPQQVDRDGSPYFGETLAHVTVELYNVGSEMKTRKHFFNIAGKDKRDANNRMSSMFKLANQMAKATGTVGKPLVDTLEAAKQTRLRYRIRLSPATEQYEARNWTDAVTAVRP